MATVEEIISCATSEMKTILSKSKDTLMKVKASGINPDMIRNILVPSYGQMIPLYQISNIRNLDSNTLEIKPWEKNLLQEIEKSIVKSELGINPQNNGDVIKLIAPSLTEERRQHLVRIVKNDIEDAKIKIRNIRQTSKDYIRNLKKEKISEDILKKAENDLQKITDEMIDMLDVFFSQKQKELLTL